MIMEKVETTILRNLLFNNDYCRKVLPFIKSEYFENLHERVVFEEICKFIISYDELATKEVVLIETEKRTDITEDTYKTICDYVSSLDNSHIDLEWASDITEKWCRDRAIYLALMESIKIADGQNEKKNRDAIPSILQEALSVGFDNNIGHDYLNDFEKRFEYYTRKEEKIPFDLEYFNKITGGGTSKKTLNVVLAGPNVGKSLTLTHLTSSFLLQGKNVLYITLEMSEEKIAQRIDANLLNVDIGQIKTLPKVLFDNKIKDLTEKTLGKLIIKEYPTSSAHVGHFRTLLNELSLKKHFVPDIVFVDYLNICSSSRYSKNYSAGSYTIVKSIAEELRALAVEYNFPLWTATQLTRSGYNSSDPDMSDTSESFGLPATADMMIGMIRTEELDQLNQVMFKQIKNRDNDTSINKRFVVGIDRPKMRLYDVEQSAQDDILDSGKDEEYNNEEEKTNKFSGFKF
jgi:replicative DNA helicase